MRVSFVLDARAVERGFDRMSKAGRSQLGAAFKTIRPHMKSDQRDHASKQAGPERHWVPRASSTVAKLRQGGRRARRPLGKLVSAITYQSSAAGVFATSRVPWSGVHQYGGRVARGSVIPARPFLWISDKLLEIAMNVIGRHVVAAFGGR